MQITQKYLDQLTYHEAGCSPNCRDFVETRHCLVSTVDKNDNLGCTHEAQILSYLKLLKKPKGLLINFNCSNIFREGQKTFVNEYYSALPKN